MNEKKYGRLVSVLIAVWFAIALTVGAMSGFRNSTNQPPIALGLAASMPVLIFLAWYRLSEGFRRFALSLDLRVLVFLQSWRIAGFAFIALYSVGLLPGVFAQPAGWGDVLVGLTAPLVALNLVEPRHRTGFLLWQVLGITDLVVAVATGATANLVSPNGPSAALMTVLPLSLIPTFAVPLFLIVHIVCIAQASQWKAARALAYSA